MTGSLNLPCLDGYEVSPGVLLIGDPTAIDGTDRMRCLADVHGALGLVELRLRFRAESRTPANLADGEANT